jgi:predicted DNA-binding transcriptional regulator YafY
MPKADYAYSLQRLFELLRLIPKPPVQRTISELQEELSEVLGEPVDKRWMERSLQMLKDHFPIYVNDKSRPYGWRWEKGASFDIPGMTLSEAQTLALAEQHLKPLLPKTIWDALQGLFGQARKLLGMPQHHTRGQRTWLDKVRSVPAWQPLLEPSIDEAIRDTVYQALHTNRPFRAGYQKPWQDEPVEYTIHPLGLVQRGQILYLVCVMEEFDDLRLLCLHRIRSAELLDEPQRSPPGFNLDQAIADGLFGMGGSNESIRLVARFYKPVAMHLLDTPLAEDQVMEEVDDHHLQLTATVPHTAQLQWWLQSFASEVEVIEPTELREVMAKHVDWLVRKYQHKVGVG